MDEFKQMLEHDPQLRYAQNAVRYYRKEVLPGYLERDPHRKAVVQKLSGVVHSVQSQTNLSTAGGNAAAGNANTNSNSGSVQVSRNSTPAPGATHLSNNTAGPGGNVRRHIINVDDMSKINYEMVKNVPGNFMSRVGVRVHDDNDGNDDNSNSNSNNSNNSNNNEDEDEIEDQHALEVEANAVKTKIYKGRLFDANDKVLELVGTQMNKLQEQRVQDEGSLADKLTLQEQLECLTKVHKNIVREYNLSVEEEKKWYILKELMLDANAELDLFSSQNYNNKGINLGEPASGATQNTSSVLVFDRTKRRKLSHNHSNIL